MGQYSKKGLYSGYDKNHKEREALDYYATPTKEVVNILETIGLDLKGKYVLEPCCGGGHMVEGILQYEPKAKIIATDVQGRENHFAAEHILKILAVCALEHYLSIFAQKNFFHYYI